MDRQKSMTNRETRCKGVYKRGGSYSHSRCTFILWDIKYQMYIYVYLYFWLGYVRSV